VILEARLRDATAALILDTGMSSDGLLLYNRSLKKSVGAESWSSAGVAGGGSGAAAAAAVAEGIAFAIGPQAFTGQRVVVLENDAFAGFPSDGVIGHSLFGHHAVEIDYDALQITLHEPKGFAPGEGWHRLPLTFRENRIPWVEATISVDGEVALPVSLYIDLASREALELLLRDGIAYRVPDAALSYYLGRGLSGDIHGRRGTVPWLRIGPYTLRDVATAFAPAEVRSRQRGADGVLGNDAVRRFNAVFDYAGHSLYLKPNAHHGEPFQ
jgi:hypothetical protein